MGRFTPSLLIAGLIGLAAACGGGGDGDMTDPDAGAIEGSIVDDVGDPVPNITVGLRRAGAGSDLATRETDANGSYRFSDLEPGDYEVRATVPATFDLDGQANPIGISVEAGQAATADFTLRLRAGMVTGVVEDDGGTPIENATADLRRAGTTQSLDATVTDASGAYTFDRVAVGDYDILLRAPAGFTVATDNPVSVTVTEGSTAQADFTLSVTPVSFSNDVQPVFNNTCAFSGCHGTMATQEDLVLVAGQAYDEIVDIPSNQLPSMDLIEPGEPDLSYLIHKIQGTQDQVGGSGEQMPEGQAALPQETIDMIRLWVSDGALEN